MLIRFIGTGAADWGEKFEQDEEYRRFSSMLINGEVLIDVGPLIFTTEDGAELFAHVEHVLQTHSHEDHLAVRNLQRLCNLRGRNLWCDENIIKMAYNVRNLEKHSLSLFIPTAIGEYTVTALPANHGTYLEKEQPRHYLIEKAGKTVFYGCDGAWFLRETWYALRKKKIDLFVLDGTLGDLEGDARIFEHNNLRMVEMMAESIRKQGILTPGGKIIISHISRRAQEKHELLVKRMEKADILVAYDGLCMEI